MSQWPPGRGPTCSVQYEWYKMTRR